MPGKKPRKQDSAGRHGKKPRLSPSQWSKLEAQFREKIGKIDRTDVKYVLDKTLGKVQSLMHSGVDWISNLGRQVTLLFEMLRDWWNGGHECPWVTVATITAALLYFINPIDFIPDIIPLAGFLDDAAVMAICLKLIQTDLRKYAKAKKIDLEAYGL
ncbi:MAG: DUF1232 domain-containing protein [Planctomycetes bacterium]|nr:DUF1232 domain-containing protein [Planctomycetota bacterium]